MDKTALEALLNNSKSHHHKVTPIPAQIRAGRALLGWTQSNLGDYIGMTKPGIAMIESGKRQPTARTMDKICKVFWDAGLEFIEDGGVKQRNDIVEVLEGQEGIVRFFEGLHAYLKLNGGEYLVSGADEEKFDDVQGVYAEEYIRKMSKLKNISCKVLICEGDANTSAVEYAEYRAVPRELFQIFRTYIYADKVAIILWHDAQKKIIAIHDKELAAAYRQQFYFMWELAKPNPALQHEKNRNKKAG